MSEIRPLLNARVEQLEELFQQKRNDPRTLRVLTAELVHRESSRAKSLLEEINAYLEEPIPLAHVEITPSERSQSCSTKDVFSEDSPIGEVEEADGLYPVSEDDSDGLMAVFDLSVDTSQIPSRLTAREGANWLHEVATLFGTSELNLHVVEIFLRVAHADRSGEPLGSRELARLVGVSSSAVSRNIGHLGEWAPKNRPGLGLVTALPLNSDRRRKPIRLTAKGRQLVRMIEGL